MSIIGLKDYFLEVSRGNVSGQSHINKFGRNDTITSAGSAEDIWDGGGTYSFPATADITHIKSSVVGDTSITIEVQGLDTNWAEVTQTKALDASDATTLVALDTALRRVFRAKVNDSTAPTGNVTVENSGGTTTYAQITAGNNQTLMAIYTIPATTTGYMINYYGTINKGAAKAPDAVTLKLFSQDNQNSYVQQIKHVVGIEAGGESIYRHDFGVPVAFTQKTDIWINGTAIGSAVTADVSAGFDIVLIDD